jgi:hypothetical protein
MARKKKDVEDRVADTELEPEKPDPGSAGQAGDTQGLSNIPQATSQSVEELVEEGQYFEAAVVSGVEDVPPADESEVKTREVPADDVPGEYLDQDQDVDPGY